MIFKGWQKTSLNEWPGKVCSVVFVQGCNFFCPFCYNPDLVSNPEKLPTINQEEVLDYCEKNKDLLDGVMITGGEPLIQVKKDLIRFIKKIKKLGLKIGIETNGNNPEIIEYLIKNGLIDYIAMDIKAPLIEEKYSQLAGVKVDLKKIKKIIKIIIDSKIESEFRTTIVPGLLDENDILKIAQEIKRAKRYYLQQFQPGKTLGQVPDKKSYDKEWFEQVAKKIKNLINIELRI